MARLLAAQAVAIGMHASKYVLIAHCSGFVVQVSLFKSLQHTEVAHNRGDNRSSRQATMLVQVHAAHIQDKIAIYHMAALVYRKATVCIAVISKAHIKTLLHNKTLQTVDMRGAAVNVDIEAIRGIADNANIGTQSIEHGLCNRRGRTIGAIKANLYALQGKIRTGNKVGNVAIAALHVINRCANRIARHHRHFFGIFAVNVLLNKLKQGLFHLETLGINQLDAVIRIRIVASGNHHTAIECAIGGFVRKAWGGNNVQHIGVCTRGNKARDHTAFQHVAGTTGVFAHNDTSLAALTCAIVPADKATNFVCMLNGKVGAGNAAEAVCAKILHFILLFTSERCL